MGFLVCTKNVLYTECTHRRPALAAAFALPLQPLPLLCSWLGLPVVLLIQDGDPRRPAPPRAPLCHTRPLPLAAWAARRLGGGRRCWSSAAPGARRMAVEALVFRACVPVPDTRLLLALPYRPRVPPPRVSGTTSRTSSAGGAARAPSTSRRRPAPAAGTRRLASETPPTTSMVPTRLGGGRLLALAGAGT